MFKRDNRGLCCLLVFVMLFTLLSPFHQQYSSGAYAAQIRQTSFDDYFSEEIQKLLALNEINIPDENAPGATILGQEEIQSVAKPSKVGFENDNYYAVRSNDYVLIPVRLLEYESRFPPLSFEIDEEESTAVAGVDYHLLNPEDMVLDFDQLDMRIDFIAIKLMDSGEERGTRTIKLNLVPPEGVTPPLVLAPYYEAMLTIVPAYDYVDEPGYLYLYDGYNFANTGKDNWSGSPSERTYSNHKVLLVNAVSEIWTKTPYLMSGLHIEQRNIRPSSLWFFHGVDTYVSPSPSKSNAISRRSFDYATWDFFPYTMSPDNPADWRQELYVGFSAEINSNIEIRTVKMDKGYLDVNVYIPKGSSLVVGEEEYYDSFNGRFNKLADTLKAEAGKGFKFEKWVMSWVNEEGYVEHDWPGHLFDSEVSIKNLIDNLRTSRVHLYPIFSQPSYTISAYAWPAEGGVAVAGKEHYRKDSTVSLQAIANQGYRFLHWFDWETGEVISTEAEFSFPAQKNMSIVANFRREIGFEHAQYYAVRSNGYVLIPVVFTEPESAVSYSVTGGTAVAGVDYEEVGENRTMYGWDYDGGIAFIPIKLIDSGQEGTRTIRLELHSPQDLVLGEQYWADVIIGPDYNYQAAPGYKYLYNGYDLDNTGKVNWNGGAALENSYDTYNTLYIPSYDGVTTDLYPMAHLSFRWANRSPGKALAIVASYLPGYRLPYPGEGEIFGMLEITEPMAFQDDSFPLEDKRGTLMQVGFYTEEGAALEVVTVEMQKRQYDVRVNLPRGGSLEVMGENYNETFSDSFNGRFDYEGAERLKAVPEPGYSFGGWMCYHGYDPDYVSESGSPGKAEYLHLSGVGAEMTIQELTTAMGNAFGFMDSKDSWIQLRPMFTQKNVTIEAMVELDSADKGTATGGGTYRGGNPVALKAIPDPGFAFSHWYITGKGNVFDNPYIFTAVEDLQAYAYFKPGFTIKQKASPVAGGEVELVHVDDTRTLDLVIDGEYFVGKDETVIARATPNPGYAFVGWAEKGEQVWPTAEYAFDVEKDRFLDAIFVQNEQKITVKANPIGIVSGGGTYDFGSEVTLTAKPHSGYVFVNWTVKGEEKSREPIYTFQLTDPNALDYTANFQLTSFVMKPYKQFVGEPVQFDASMILEDNENITFDWDFGDGGKAFGRDAGPVYHTFNATGKYTVSVIARAGTVAVATTIRDIVIVEPLPLEQSDFRVEPRGISLVEPGGQIQWTVEFSNNGVPMMGKSITVTDEVANKSANITVDEYGRAFYETTVPESGELGSFHNVTFSYETLRASVAVQIHSAMMTLSGQVLDSQSGRRLTGVRVVTADGKEGITNEEGVYTITGLSYGETCFLSVNHNGYFNHNSSRKLDSAQAEHHISLVLKPGNDPHILRTYSERTDSSTRVDTFLTYGDSLSLTVQTVINWGDYAPGKVDFILPNKTVQGTLNSMGASRQINMDEEFKPGERLYVQAYSGGVGYEVRDALFEVMPPPPFDTDSKEFELPPIDDLEAPADLKYIGGMGFGFDFKSMKTDFVISDDGVASLYIGYVIDKKNAQPDDLSDPDKLREATKILDKLGGQKSVSKSTTDFDLVLGGKFTWAYCQTETDWVLKEGWMAITGSASVTKTYYYMTPILVPVYIQAGAGGSISVKLMLVSDDHFFLDGTLTPALWLRVAAGVGLAGLLSAEIFGKIDGSLELGIVSPDYKVEVGITGGVKVVAFIYSETFSYRQAWKWPEVGVDGSYVLVLSDPGEVKPISRDYLKQPSIWLPSEEIRVMSVGDGEVNNFKEMTIQTNVFPYSESQLIRTADGPMLVWIADHSARTDDNRTMVQYSLYDGTTWAAPQPIRDDGTADFYHKVVGWQGNQDKIAAAAWMNVAEVLGDHTDYEELLSKTQVAVSFYHRSANTWADFVEFSPQEGYQYTAPEIGAASNSALVVWNRSPLLENSDLIATLYPDQTDILFSYWNGSNWSVPGMAVAGAGRVIKSSLAYDGEKAILAYVVDEDGSFETVGDQELYYTTFVQGNWSVPVRVTNNNVQDTNPQAVYLNGEPLLFWYQDGKVLYLKNLAGSPKVAVERQSDGLSDFTLAAGENDSLALVWGDGVAKEPVNGSQVLNDHQDMGAQEIFTSVYDPMFNSWSQPIQLTHSGLFNRSIDAMLDAEGNVLAVFNRATVAIVELEGEELEFETERTDLIFTELSLGFDLAVEDITLSEENPVPGSRVTASALVANLGERACEDVKVAFYEGDPQFGGRKIGENVILEGVLGGGERRLASIEWDIPKKLEARQLYIVVDPRHEVPDRNRQNNKDFVSAAMADLEIAEVITQMVGFDEFLITATVINRGLITAENTVVSLYATEAGEYGPVRGDYLEQGNLGGLLPGDQKEVTLSWMYKESDFGEDDTTFLALEATSPTPNVLGGANTARVLIRKPVTEGGTVQGFELGRNIVTLFVGDQYQLQGIFTPADASNRGITWQSNNEGIAQVDAGGKVSAKEEGTAIITATTQDGSFTDTCTVTVLPIRLGVSRISGGTRYQTAVKVSFAGWPDGANTVVLARGDNYPDSLAGVSLAYQLNAPILLTATNILNIDTKQEIERLGANRVIILGGTGAISAQVETELSGMFSVDIVDRLGGANRYETTKLVAKELAKGASFDTAFFASGLNFPDALAAASYGALNGYPILLTGKDRLPDATKETLDNMPSIKNIVIVGGEMVISSTVMAELEVRGLNVKRISGGTRYETAIKLANEYLPGYANEVFITTGLNFPDALAGGVLAAKRNGGILLVPGDRLVLYDEIATFITSNHIMGATILGGETAVSEGIENDLRILLD